MEEQIIKTKQLIAEIEKYDEKGYNYTDFKQGFLSNDGSNSISVTYLMLKNQLVIMEKLSSIIDE